MAEHKQIRKPDHKSRASGGKRVNKMSLNLTVISIATHFSLNITGLEISYNRHLPCITKIIGKNGKKNNLY